MLKVKLNDDEEKVEEIRKKLKENDGYCPCAIQKTSDTKCMCREFKNQISMGIPGPCHCGLHILVEE